MLKRIVWSKNKLMSDWKGDAVYKGLKKPIYTVFFLSEQEKRHEITKKSGLLIL